MDFSLGAELASLGYVAVLIVVGLEYMGIPLPGETALVGAAVLAGQGSLSIGGVWASGFVGSVVGAGAGYYLGSRFGLPLARRYGARIHLDEGRLKIGQYLFQRYGFAILFFGRFVALLRTLSAFLAGVNRYDAKRFMIVNVLGGIVWTSVFALGGYWLGTAFEHYARPVAIGAVVLVLAILFVSGRVIARLEDGLREKAEAAFPGPLA